MQGGGTSSNIYSSLGGGGGGGGGGLVGALLPRHIEGDLTRLGAFKLILAHLNSFRLI